MDVWIENPGAAVALVAFVIVLLLALDRYFLPRSGNRHPLDCSSNVCLEPQDNAEVTYIVLIVLLFAIPVVYVGWDHLFWLLLIPAILLPIVFLVLRDHQVFAPIATPIPWRYKIVPVTTAPV